MGGGAALALAAGTLALSAVITPGPELTGSVDRVVSDPEITESSGLTLSARFPGVLYTHNDSDGDPAVYAVDQSGATAARLSLSEAPARGKGRRSAALRGRVRGEEAGERERTCMGSALTA